MRKGDSNITTPVTKRQLRMRKEYGNITTSGMKRYRTGSCAYAKDMVILPHLA